MQTAAGWGPRLSSVAAAVGRSLNDAPLEIEYLGAARPKRVERHTKYSGERPSALSFFFMWPRIIFRWHGSVIPFILVEVAIALGLSFVALYWFADETYGTTLHSVMGTLLSFLIAMRTQMAFTEYTSGNQAIGGLMMAARCLMSEALGAVSASNRVRRHGTLPVEIHEVARLTKLFFYCCVEHVRSSDGHEAWEYANRVAHSFATEEEVSFFETEFGQPQLGGQRRMVQPARSTEDELRVWDPTRVKRTDEQKSSRGAAGMTPALVRLDNRWRHSKQFTREESFTRGNERHCPHDPSRAKPLVVLVWIREMLSELEESSTSSSGALDQMGYSLKDMSASLGGVNRVDSAVLPLPYCQMLKLLLMSYVFSLPFVIVNEVGWTLPYGMVVIALAFFGLDQVSAELESPFGVDANDFPLMSMGIELADDLDVMVRGAEHVLQRRRRKSLAATPQRPRPSPMSAPCTVGVDNRVARGSSMKRSSPELMRVQYAI